jgi:hypothetical protein
MTSFAFATETPLPGKAATELARILGELKDRPCAGVQPSWDIRPYLEPAGHAGSMGFFAGYEILEVIAHGGMGIVLEARDPALDRLVAIKVLAPALAGKESYRQRFVREARAAAALQHDHIVVIHAVGEKDGLPFIVMQRLAGPSLEEHLARSGPMAHAALIRVGQQIASALRAAHDAGLVHRDIKPANVLMEDGLARVRITDFGLVHSVSRPMVDDGCLFAGTPQFTSPEQAAGEPVTPASDLFSFGATLYALATGRPPFEASSLGDLLKKIRSEVAPSVETQRPDLPMALCRLIRRLMAGEAQARPTAREAAEQLAALAQPVKRMVRFWVAFGTLAILLLIVSGLLWRKAGDVAPRPVRFTIESSGASFDSLAACVAAADSGDTIEVSGEQPLTLEPVRVRGKALRIRAAPTARPELIGTNRHEPLLDTDAPLVLEGITLEHRIVELSAPPLIRVTNAPLQLAFCRLLKASLVPRMAADRVFCIEAFDSPRIELYHCEVVPLERAVGGVFGRFRRDTRPDEPEVSVIRVEHSLMTGIEAFELENETPEPVHVELTRSIFVNRVMLRLDDLVPANLLRVKASDSVFDVESLLFGATIAPNEFQRQFQWLGSGNRFSVRIGFVVMPHGGRPASMPGYPVTAARWAEFEQVIETGSRAADLDLWNDLLEAGAQPENIRADRVVLPPTLELENAPDLTRIGPGAPYAEWRRSAAYREWERLLEDGR